VASSGQHRGKLVLFDLIPVIGPLLNFAVDRFEGVVNFEQTRPLHALQISRESNRPQGDPW
jgi:hypothetical protein